MAAAVAAMNRLGSRAVGRAALVPVLAAIRIRYGLASLAPVEDGSTWAVEGAINPTSRRGTMLPRLSGGLQALRRGLTDDRATRQFDLKRQQIGDDARWEAIATGMGANLQSRLIADLARAHPSRPGAAEQAQIGSLVRKLDYVSGRIAEA